MWNVESGRDLRTLKGHEDYVNAVALKGDGRFAVSASADKTLKVWNVESGRELHSLKGHKDSVTGVALSGGGRLAVSTSLDGTLRVWDVQSARELMRFTATGEEFRCCACSIHADTIVAVNRNGVLYYLRVRPHPRSE